MGIRYGVGPVRAIGKRQSDLKKSFKLAFRSLLTTCSSQVGVALDTVEQLVGDQSLDPMFSERTNVMDAVYGLSTAKKTEINYLRGLLERAGEHNRLIQARVELLGNMTQEVSGTTC